MYEKRVIITLQVSVSTGVGGWGVCVGVCASTAS